MSVLKLAGSCGLLLKLYLALTKKLGGGGLCVLYISDNYETAKRLSIKACDTSTLELSDDNEECRRPICKPARYLEPDEEEEGKSYSCM